IENQLVMVTKLMTEPDAAGNESLAKDYLDYMKKGKPYYYEIYDGQLACYQNFSDVLLSAANIMVEYYHYFSGPYNPRSRFITINQEDLIVKMDSALEALYSELDINDNDKPRTMYGVPFPASYGVYIQGGIFEDGNQVRVRSTVNRKTYLLTVGGSWGVPQWNEIYNLDKTPYGPKDEYLAAGTVTDEEGRAYHPVKDDGEVDGMLQYYNDYNAKDKVKTEQTIYDFWIDHHITSSTFNHVDKNGKVGNPISYVTYLPIALWQFDDMGQFYLETTTHNADKILTYEDAKKGVAIHDPKHSQPYDDQVFNYIFVEDTKGGN
ncbi:MAG: hypothetical protein RR614_01420, partial [Eubacterium sp.]